ncbi:MAG: DUF2089 domain-containing protein [Chloroflexi bacterium]|nr:DUF2089 domain-containing protein [Chloroflexota bacterium]
MRPLPTQCPLCGGEITVTRLYCPECDATIEGHFSGGPFSKLTLEQLRFVETFIRCEGKLTRMQEELGLSYPTIRSRLHEVIRALGYEPGREEPSPLSPEERRRILDDLDEGKITYEQAMRLLRGEGR